MPRTPFPTSNPIEALVDMAAGLWVSRALWAAARLGIADAVGDAPTPLTQIAAASGTQVEPLRRLMNALVSIGLFEAAGDDLYAHSDISPFLKSDHPLTQLHFIDGIFGGEHYAAWGALDESVRSGTTAFDHVYGEPVFDRYGRHPDEAERFSRAMSGSTRIMEAAMLATWTAPDFELAVDLGGSRGTLLASLLAQRPEARGILFDLPEVADAVRPTLGNDRIEAIGGNFFESVPAGDLYLLKFILPDWTDAQCATILRNVRAAIRPGGRIMIVETVLPETPGPAPGFLMDLNMMVMTGGRERSAADFEALLAATGFKLENVTPTPLPIAVVQGVAA